MQARPRDIRENDADHLMEENAMPSMLRAAIALATLPVPEPETRLPMAVGLLAILVRRKA